MTISPKTHFDIELRKKLENHSRIFPSITSKKYPHVVERINDLWGSADLLPYLNTLILAEARRKEGFPEDVSSELLCLLNFCHDQNKTLSSKNTDTPQTKKRPGPESLATTPFSKRKFDAELALKLKNHSELFPSATLKNHPHVVKNINEAWGKQSLAPYLNSLVIAEDRRKEGFSLEVISELLRISDFCKKQEYFDIIASEKHQSKQTKSNQFETNESEKKGLINFFNKIIKALLRK